MSFVSNKLFEKLVTKTLTIDLTKLESLKKSIENASRVSMEVGVFGNNKLKKIALFQEYGTSRGIPPRSFLRKTYNESWKEMGKELIKDLIVSIQKYSKDGYDLSIGQSEKVFKVYGNLFVDLMKDNIYRGLSPALKKATIKAKKKKKYPFPSTALVGRGDLVNAIRVKMKRKKAKDV